MKIAVSVNEPSENALVDSRFGRAPFFLVFDTESGAYSFAENSQNLNALQGAGIQSAQTVARLGANVLISGHCGPKAFQALSTAGIKIVSGASGSAKDAIAAFQAGKLSEAAGADVEGHW